MVVVSLGITEKNSAHASLQYIIIAIQKQIEPVTIE